MEWKKEFKDEFEKLIKNVISAHSSGDMEEKNQIIKEIMEFAKLVKYEGEVPLSITDGVRFALERLGKLRRDFHLPVSNVSLAISLDELLKRVDSIEGIPCRNYLEEPNFLDCLLKKIFSEEEYKVIKNEFSVFLSMPLTYWDIFEVEKN